ncbi:H+ Antiporter protein [Actinomyces bovis]|uniref:H+ Antiporter protein n=2 Tax=Actinomyces bovis TaxID=1658 RepID=A0ABY1VQL7_9ACTO|nr:H+ Antiporter protein [Actinomyces bovis]VEG56263.1 H+ Antiporter protein [Actinomyces israelii]
MLLVSSTSFGVFALGITVSPNVWAIFLMNFLCGVFVPLFVTPAMTEVQKRVNEEYMGRLMSQFTLSFTLGMPLGVAVFGPLSTLVGVGGVIAVTGAAAIGLSLWAFLVSPTGRAELQRERQETGEALG